MEALTIVSNKLFSIKGKILQENYQDKKMLEANISHNVTMETHLLTTTKVAARQKVRLQA